MPNFRVGALLASAALAAAMFAGGQAEARKITYASFLSATHPVHQAVDEFFERVNEDTDGSLTFETFPGGSMGGGKAMLNLVRDGLVDSAFINAAYLPSNLPAGAVLISMFAPEAMPAAGAANETQLLECPQCVKELKDNDVTPLAYYSTASYALMCNRAIESIDELEGLKIRTSGGFNYLATKLGAVPVNLTGGEVYEGLQRGQLDCVLGAPGWLKSYNLVDLVKGVIDHPLGVYQGIVFMNMKTSVWTELSDAERKAIMDNLPELVRDVTVIYVQENEEARELAAEKGIPYTEPDPRLAEVLEEFQQDEYARILQKAKDDGVVGAEESLKAFQANLEKWQGIVDEIDGDPDKFAEALEREVFSKYTP